MKIGYARVSTHDQTLDLQIDALNADGCDRIFTDEGVSGAKSSRPEWDKCLDQLRKGDVLVIWKLDRAGRSTKHLIEVSEFLEFKGVELRSIQDQIDTSTAMGKFFFRTMASIAELERDIIKERTEAGLKAARARGRKGGRKKTVTKGQELEAKRLAEAGEMPITEICKQVGISRATYYRLVD
ncbi:recombinase family protein [Leptothoe kymatousa]|uniref:Recombinase family protein n=1 Tax=Leptothoe kymatousa TAU-MAC 1615 TaxID=2364775 RepID=A0ABS5Y406_9CYAN|nr:recombinase family protein [Leptothoe kymatousa]MBT9312552.1 recombinase family protein [Leptothoe kymatousa TAU-MAC 1615]